MTEGRSEREIGVIRSIAEQDCYRFLFSPLVQDLDEDAHPSIVLISLRLFAHGAEHVSHPRSARRVYVAPSSYITNTNLAIEDRETARYARKVIATLVILLAWIISALLALVVR